MFSIKFRFLLGYFSSTSLTAAAPSRNHGHPQQSTSRTSSPKPMSVESNVRDPLVDIREASLSTNTRRMQRFARLNYDPCRILITERTSSKRLRAQKKICPEEAARIDKQSLKALEDATRRATRSPEQPKSARSQRRNPSGWVSPSPCQLQPGDFYKGTPPYESPSTPADSDFNIHSIPSNMPSDPTDSELFRSDCKRLISTVEVKETAEALGSLRSEANEVRASHNMRVQEWLDGSRIEMLEPRLAAPSSQECSMREGSTIASEQVACRERDGASEDVEAITRINTRCKERRAEPGLLQDGGGHSLDSWSAEEQDHNSPGSAMLGTQSREAGGVPEDSSNEAADVGQHDEEEEAWLDIGFVDDAQ